VHTSDARVREWMTEDPLTATAEMDVEDAAQVMLQHNFRHLPILDESGAVVGLVSLRRVVAATQATAHNPA
jgi:CBS domain-containing protein